MDVTWGGKVEADEPGRFVQAEHDNLCVIDNPIFVYISPHSWRIETVKNGIFLVVTSEDEKAVAEQPGSPEEGDEA